MRKDSRWAVVENCDLPHNVGSGCETTARSGSQRDNQVRDVRMLTDAQKQMMLAGACASVLVAAAFFGAYGGQEYSARLAQSEVKSGSLSQDLYRNNSVSEDRRLAESQVNGVGSSESASRESPGSKQVQTEK
jgi:hypothetical protein